MTTLKLEYVDGTEGLMYEAWGELKSEFKVIDEFYHLKSKAFWICRNLQGIYTAPYGLYNIISESFERLYKRGTTTFEIYRLTVMVIDMLNYAPRFNPTGEYHIKFDNETFNRWVKYNQKRY